MAKLRQVRREGRKQLIDFALTLRCLVEDPESADQISVRPLSSFDDDLLFLVHSPLDLLVRWFFTDLFSKIVIVIAEIVCHGECLRAETASIR